MAQIPVVGLPMMLKKRMIEMERYEILPDGIAECAIELSWEQYIPSWMIDFPFPNSASIHAEAKEKMGQKGGGEE